MPKVCDGHESVQRPPNDACGYESRRRCFGDFEVRRWLIEGLVDRSIDSFTLP